MTDRGLLAAFVLDGQGGGRPLGWEEVESWASEQGVLWVHLDRTDPFAREWVQNRSGIDPATAETLLESQGNRPRVQRIDSGLLIVLRGPNRAEGEDLDDMPSMHMWVEEKKIVTLRRRRLMAGTEIRQAVEHGRGPTSASNFIVHMAERLNDPLSPIVHDIDDAIDALQEKVLLEYNPSLRRELQSARQAAINFRRHIAPQRDALSRLQAEPIAWLEPLDRAFLREIADHTARYVEDLDAARERAGVAQDELNNQLAERMNRTMYVLTVFAALLLPPSLLTGLFGINVGGMPGVESRWAFAIVVIALPVLAAVQFMVLRRLRWI
ncbi:MAG: zinc transporter ZntB [Gammaproteobacteria bacterium]|nr:zinc transporter ZntB [Gammaproteobacteria bacterium]